MHYDLCRRDVLRMWKGKYGFYATYRHLLQVFVEAGHTECANALCELLKKKCEIISYKLM